MHAILESLLSTKRLSSQEIDQIFAKMLAGELSDAQIAAVLTAWRIKGEGVDELHAGAKALRSRAMSVPLPASARPLIDNCGTGGDGAGSFNLSTAAAIVASAAGARVAKHGNRSVSSKCGSADLLFAAGFPDTLSAEATGELLAKTGFTFFFAPNFHPVMKAVGPVRKSLGVRTVFNLLGPLANPIGPEFQVIGVGAKAYLRPMAETLAALGVKRALVVHSRDGLDEISPAAPTDALLVEKSTVREMTIDPATLGVKGSLADLNGGDSTHNLGILEKLLASGTGALADTVALNAGAVLWIAEKAPDLKGGLDMARRQLTSGAARDHFKTWIALARSLATAGRS